MTVESARNKAGPFNVTGTSITIPRKFLVLDDDDVRVIRVRNGIESDITAGIRHTGIGEASGTVVISSGLRAGDKIYLLRAVPNLQRSDYNAQGRVRTDQVENDFDRVVMQIQDLSERQGRALTLGVSSEIDGEAAMAAALLAPQYAAQAQQAASDALAAAMSEQSLSALLASTQVYSLGSKLVTRADGFAYEVVSGTPSVLTAGGVRLRPLPRDGAISALQCAIPTTGDQTALLKTWMQFAADQGYIFDLSWRAFTFSEMDVPGDVDLRNGVLMSNKAAPTGLGNFQTDYALRLGGTEGAEIAVTADFETGDESVTLASVAGIEIGDLLHLQSTRLIDTDHRGAWQEGQVVKVRAINGTRVYFDTTLVYSGRANASASGTITAISADRYTLTVSNMLAGNGRDKTVKVTITSGAAAGESRMIIAAGATTLRHSGSQPGEWERSPWPAGVQVGDTITHSWVTTATVIKPAKIKLTNVTILRDKVFTANSGDTSFRGLRIRNADAPLIRDCTVNNFAMTNIHLSKCHRPVVENCDVSGANLSYSGSNGTGYGVSIETCSEATVRNTSGQMCRRVVDYSGSSGYSENGLCENVVARGGGVTYAGQRFWPAGPALQNAVGSHGSGRFTRYINCVGINVYRGINLRGREEIVRGYTHIGYGVSAIGINYGSGHVIDGVSCIDTFSEDLRGPDFRQERATPAGRRLEYVVFMDFADPFAGNITTTIRNVRANSVSRCAMFLNGSGAVIQNLVLENWHVSASDEGTSGVTDFAWFIASVIATFDDCVFNDCYFNLPSGVNYSGYEALFGVGAQYEVVVGGRIKIDDLWFSRVAAGGLTRFPCRQQTATITIQNVRTGAARPRCNGLMIEDGGSAPMNAAPDRTNMDVLATFPSGTAGVASGNFGVNISQSEGFISVVNNTTTDQTFKMRVA